MFSSHGTDASMGAIARTAGVGMGTMYRHFSDKQTLLEAVLVAELDRLEADVRWRLPGPESGAELAAFLRGVAADGRANAAVKEALAASGVDVRAATKAAARGLRRALGELLVRAHAQRSVRADVTVDDVMDLLAAVVAVVSAQGTGSARGRRLVDVLVDGLRPP
jgi:AcrR family transcriptional regulator